jgi:hypothetical protein
MSYRIVQAFEWLTPRVLTERFQLVHLIANYSLLVLVMALYLAGVVGVGMISLACIPGALIFFLSVECLVWQMVNGAENPLMLLMNIR